MLRHRHLLRLRDLLVQRSDDVDLPEDDGRVGGLGVRLPRARRARDRQQRIRSWPRRDAGVPRATPIPPDSGSASRPALNCGRIGWSASCNHPQKSLPRPASPRPRRRRPTHPNRNHRSRSIPHERCVVPGLARADDSAKNAVRHRHDHPAGVDQSERREQVPDRATSHPHRQRPGRRKNQVRWFG